MDYESLYSMLPKEPKRWSSNDVVRWLEFIGLPTYQDIFGFFLNFLILFIYSNKASNSIDGSCLELINENDLEEEIKIKSNIHKKKIMNCK